MRSIDFTTIETEISTSECLQLYVSYFSYKSTYQLHSASIPLITEQFNVSTFSICFVRAYVHFLMTEANNRDYPRVPRSFSNSPAVIRCFTSPI